MNTIDYIAKGQKVQFSTKSVNINGKDYAYTGMTAIKHSSTKHLYLFKYEDSWCLLPYNEEDEQKLKALFSRIAALNAKRAETRTEKIVSESAHVTAPQAPKIDVKTIMERTVEPIPAEEPIQEKTAVEPVAEEPAEAAAVEEPVKEKIVEEKPAEGTAEEKSAEEVPAEEPAEGIYPPEERKSKLKKSFKIFAAVIAAFIILAVVYFFVAGTSNNPTVGPNSDETQQYEDIDGLIEDLQDDN